MNTIRSSIFELRKTFMAPQKMHAILLLLGLVTIWCNYSVDCESVEDHIARERIKLACRVQVVPVTTQLFDECIKENGMPYNLKQVFSPCTSLAGLDLNTYDGIFNFTCKEQGKNRPEVISCVVKNIGTASPSIDIVQLSKTAMEIAKVCSQLVAKALADEALAKAKDITSNLKLPKLG